MCVTAAEARPVPDLDRIWRTCDDRHREWLAMNAALPVPLPVCRVCIMPHCPEDEHPVIDGTCGSCGGQILEDLTLAFIFAKNKRARRKAAAALRALAYES